ncbi:ATP-binding protein [Algibacillus agarilyticus]|uniref:ATP-binding protein n=1 Tax=Algibacillus agarilyticus TaxID=2234133 RepID=UPI000DD04757|nr:ATP-binding protein [Algibacillus agarilyticus]
MRKKLNWFKSEVNLAYFVLFVSFIISFIVNTLFVSDRATTTLSKLMDRQIELQANSTFNNINQFIENRFKVINEITRNSVVVSNVMGIASNSLNLADYLDHITILDEKEHIKVADFEGNIIYSSLKKDESLPLWAHKINLEERQSAINIMSHNQQHYFQLALPVKYNNFVEGVLLVDIMSQSIEDILQPILDESVHAINFINTQGLNYSSADLSTYSSVANFDVPDSELTLNFYVAPHIIENEKNSYVEQIGLTLALNMLLSFIVLVSIIRSVLIRPLKRIAESERIVKHQKERFQLAILGSNDGIWDWDLTIDELYMSPKLMDMLQLSPCQHSDKKPPTMNEIFEQHVHPDDQSKNRDALKKHFRSDTPYDTEHRVLVGARYRYFRARGITHRNEQGKPIRMAGSLTDITDFKQQRIALEEALNKAKAASLAKSEFLANMSHEIRTPMNGVLGALQILQRSKLPDDSHKLVETGIISSKSLLALINDILDLSKIESNNIELECIPTDIITLLSAVKEEQSLAAQQKSIKLTVNAEALNHSTWLIDPVRLKQIITNLTSNAIKFTNVGEVAITVSEKNEQIKIAIQDSGIGISKAHLDKLFFRFEQADTSTTRKYGGSGLGLAISKQLAELMQGDITVVSQENIGSCFTLTFKADKSATTKPTQNAQAVDHQPEAANYHILLAEDNEINQIVFCSILEPTHANIEIASDGLEAVKQALDNKPDLIFMDIQMPNMDGIQACKQIKSNYPDLPIIALTANVMSNDIEKYIQSGFDAYISKPVNIKELYQVLAEHLKSKN